MSANIPPARVSTNTRTLGPSVRRKFKAGDSQYDINRSFFHRCLYDNETGDPTNIESGFLKGPLLLKVRELTGDRPLGCRYIDFVRQTFKHIFTSPSSVDTLTDDSQPTQKRRRQPSQRTVVNILGMDSQVTPRTLAYAVVQVCSLSYCRVSQLNRTS